MIAADVGLTKEQVNRAARNMSHWVNVAKDLYESKNEDHILKLLYIELNTRQRYYIIQRIYAHYNSVRRKRELEEIRAWNHMLTSTKKPLLVEDSTDVRVGESN